MLDLLKQFDAKGTFFCVGDNVVSHPEIYTRIISEGHSIGNHTQNHLNGWKTNSLTYYKNVLECGNHVKSNLFRPPYGRITPRQLKTLKARYKIVLWNILSGDYNQQLSEEDCLSNVVGQARSGDIVVFHDSLKAAKNLKFALPKTLEHFKNQGFSFLSLPYVPY